MGGADVPRYASCNGGLTMRLYAYYRSSASYRVRIALAHKNIPYQIETVSLTTGENRGDAHLARNPLGQLPVLELEVAGQKVHLAQSVALLEYIEETHPEPALLPKEPIARAKVRELVELVNSGIQPLQNTPVLADVKALGYDPEDWARKYIGKGLHALVERAASRAAEFLLGDTPTLADVVLVPQMYNARRFGVDLTGLERLVDIDARCRALPRWNLASPELQPDAPKE